MDWSHVAQNEVQWLALHVNKPSVPIKDAEFHEQLEVLCSEEAVLLWKFGRMSP
jgi:hypothetical protein